MGKHFLTFAGSVGVSALLHLQYVNRRYSKLNSELHKMKTEMNKRIQDVQYKSISDIDDIKYGNNALKEEMMQMKKYAQIANEEKDTYVLLGTCAAVMVFGIGIMSGAKN